MACRLFLLWMLVACSSSSSSSRSSRMAAAAFGFAPSQQTRMPSPTADHHRRRQGHYTRAAAAVPARIHASSSSLVQLYFFNNRNKKTADEEEDEKDDNDAAQVEDTRPFFARLLGPPPPPPAASESGASTENPLSPSSQETAATAGQAQQEQQQQQQQQSPVDQARAFKAQAEKMRLEAERMDAQLTLSKIERLEQQLERAQTKKSEKGATVEDLQREMQVLQAKVRGESVAAVPPNKATTTSTTTPSSTTSSASVSATAPEEDMLSLSPVNEEDLQYFLDAYERSPDGLKSIMAMIAGMPDYSDISQLNATEVALRMERLQRSDYLFLEANFAKPSVSQHDVDTLVSSPLFAILKPDRRKDESEEEMAKRYLEEKYYSELLLRQITDNAAVDFFDFGAAANLSTLDETTMALFPPATRKDGETPTMVQAMTVMTSVLPKAGFSPSGKPEPIPGGYIIRGVNRKEDADSLLESIDMSLATSSVQDKLSVFFVKDFTVFTEDIDSEEAANADPIIMVTGPNVYREPKPIVFSAVSAMGIASSWYLSIYPFLLNPDLMKRAEEQMSLADANMAYDLTWLTDLSLPLFATFMGIQFTHEIAHRVVAAVYDMNTTVPTFVPSLVSGMTSAVTTFKSPPKNREAMFDFSVAGPLAGIAASILALYLGLQYTLFSPSEAYAQFPALPLEILRQSTLGGGIIEYVLGSGALGVPPGAEGSSAIANINISLHPVAIAGYIGLIVNSLALLPIGTTDGGRIAMTLFSRGAKTVVAQPFLFLLLVFGLFGSDLFLFYFSFLIFFQQGNEIPARNEVDEVSFSRVLLATFAGVLSLLVLIPIS